MLDSKSKHPPNPGKYQPNMNMFCDWFSETIVISVYDSFFRNMISIALLSFIVLINQSQRLLKEIGGDPDEAVSTKNRSSLLRL